MVDVTEKPEVFREAVAKGLIKLKSETLGLVKEGHVEKGDVFSVARVAGVLAAKNTSGLIPLCHPLPLTNVRVDLKAVKNGVECVVTVRTRAQTGVEMEALAGVVMALLTVWDMVKQYEKDERGQYPSTVVEGVRVVSKMKEG
jgi:cyclic pyranopterin phosphate synthase